MTALDYLTYLIAGQTSSIPVQTSELETLKKLMESEQYVRNQTKNMIIVESNHVE